MAVRFDWTSVFDSSSWVTLYPNAQGFQDKFLAMCQQIARSSQFPNLDMEIEEFVTGGMLFGKEKTRMLGLSFRSGAWKKLGVYFRAQQFGNAVYYTVMKSVERGLWDALQGKSREEILSGIRQKCKNLADWEEFMTLLELGDLVFVSALGAVDPDYEKRKLAAAKA